MSYLTFIYFYLRRGIVMWFALSRSLILTRNAARAFREGCISIFRRGGLEIYISIELLGLV